MRLLEINLRALVLILAFGLVLVGCRPGATPQQTNERPASPDSVGFANRVWQVDSSSDVAPGTLYVFLSDGTLLVTSAHSTPLVGTWKADGDGITMVEEGLPYQVEILDLKVDTFKIRSNNPGGSVEMTLIPALEGHH